MNSNLKVNCFFLTELTPHRVPPPFIANSSDKVTCSGCPGRGSRLSKSFISRDRPGIPYAARYLHLVWLFFTSPFLPPFDVRHFFGCTTCCPLPPSPTPPIAQFVSFFFILLFGREEIEHTSYSCRAAMFNEKSSIWLFFFKNNNSIFDFNKIWYLLSFAFQFNEYIFAPMNLYFYF